MKLSDKQKTDVRQRISVEFELSFPSQEQFEGERVLPPSILAMILQYMILKLDENASQANFILDDLKEVYQLVLENEASSQLDSRMFEEVFTDFLVEINGFFDRGGALNVEGYTNNVTFKEQCEDFQASLNGQIIAKEITDVMKFQLTLMLKKTHGFFQQDDHEAPITGTVIDTHQEVDLNRLNRYQQTTALMQNTTAFTLFGHRVTKAQLKNTVILGAALGVGATMLSSSNKS